MYGNPFRIPVKVNMKNTSTAAAVGDGRALTVDATTSHASITSGNLIGVRAHTTIPSGSTVDGGAFVFGGQQKLTCAGTMNHADSRLAGGFAQLDISAGTYTTGQLSALWVDCGASASASAVSTQGGGQFNILRLTNTTAAENNAVIYSHADADYMWDISAPGGSSDSFATAGTPATNAGYLRILVAGSARYIPLYSSPS